MQEVSREGSQLQEQHVHQGGGTATIANPAAFMQRPPRKRIFDITTDEAERRKVAVRITNQHYECSKRFPVAPTTIGEQPRLQPVCSTLFQFDPKRKYLRTTAPADHCNNSSVIMSQHDRELMEKRPTKNKNFEQPQQKATQLQYRYLPKELILYEDDIQPTASYNAFALPVQKVFIRQEPRTTDTSQVMSVVCSDTEKRQQLWQTQVSNRPYYYDQRHLLESHRRNPTK